MKRLFAFVFLPLVLFALERVNLIRNRGFEREDSVWIVETGAWGVPNPAIGTTKDTLESITGLFSASADTKEPPSWMEFLAEDSVAISQDFIVSKKLADLDSLCWYHLIVPRGSGAFSSTYACIVGFTYANPERNGLGYGFINPVGSGVDNWVDIPEKISEDDLEWRSFEKSLQQGFVESNRVSPNQELASFVLIGWGLWWDFNRWWGQKVYWDDVQLMGYADYDVGVKEILSGDSIQPSMVYIPEARIKNFGRENAPEFYVIAEVWEGETQIYYDSLPWSLDSDTEDTVSFKELILEPPLAPQYTLTIRTVADPDECDEDDELSKLLIYEGITEQPAPDAITLQVRSLTSPLRVAYSLPYDEPGTLTLYDVAGRRIERMTVKGSGSVEFASALPSGVYFVRLESTELTITRKAVILR